MIELIEYIIADFYMKCKIFNHFLIESKFCVVI